MKTQHNDKGGMPPVNEARRKLTKAGLAVPAVLGVLASKPVLAVPWKCTVSGQVSGNVSGHEAEVCSNLGRSANGWVSAGVASWPAKFKDASGNPLLFKNAPAGNGTKFADAFAGPGGTGDATVLQVLEGTAVPRGSPHSASLVLGQETLAAAMSAEDGTIGYPAFPIHSADAIQMFNSINGGGSYPTGIGSETWSSAKVIWYLQSLHT